MLEALLAVTLTIVTNPVERRQVLDATFAHYLAHAPCPAIPGMESAHTWVEADEALARAEAHGLFIPQTVRRAAGSFTRPGALETLYTIEIDECVVNGFSHYVDVIFSAAPSRASRVAVIHDSVIPSRNIVAMRTSAGAVDELQFTGTMTVWKHAGLVNGAWAWVP